MEPNYSYSDDDATSDTETEAPSKMSMSSISASELDMSDYATLWNEFTEENNMDYQIIPLVLPGFPVVDMYEYADDNVAFQNHSHIPGLVASQTDSLNQFDASAYHLVDQVAKRKRSDSLRSNATGKTSAEENAFGGCSSASFVETVSESSVVDAASISSASGRPVRISRINQRKPMPVVNDVHSFFSDSMLGVSSGISDKKAASTFAASQRKRRTANADVLAEASYFPIQLVEKMNSGDTDEINKLLELYLTPNCRLSTKAFPHTLEGHIIAKSFFNGILLNTPDMVMCLTEVHLNPDKSVIFRGSIEGTFVGSYDDNNADDPAANLSNAKNKMSFVELLMEGRKDDTDFHLPTSEIARLQKLERDARAQQAHVKALSKWVCKIVRSRSRRIDGGSKNKKTKGHMMISKLSFDWKTCDIRAGI